jgi:formylglycine-generating enzyme required for sulfatase activity
VRWTVFLALLLGARVALGAEAPPPGMVRIPGGSFVMGTDDGFPYEGPAHRVRVSAFFMDRHEVTNDQFEKFVKATRHVTESERLGFSGVFDPKKKAWAPVKGASWRHPEGPGSSLRGRRRHPVVHVSWSDAAAYARWAGKRLPTEAEWERAARGGHAARLYPWGNDLRPRGRFAANIWQGDFPEHDLGEDGFSRIAPVESFAANDYGLYDIAGNVWEWTADTFGPDTYDRPADLLDPKGPATGEEKVIRGGSWICSTNYCTGYRVAARQKTPPDSGLNNLGFRCVK